MAKLNPLFGSLKTLDITYQSPSETLGTPETLPTTEPSTPQIGYTVAEGDLPTYGGLSPYSKKFVAFLYAAGQVVTGASISWRMKKNGGSVASGSQAVAANYYYTLTAYFHDVTIGDVLEIALWSSQTNSNWDYKAYQIIVTRLILMNKPRLLAPCNFTNYAQKPVLTLGNPLLQAFIGYYPHSDDLNFPESQTTRNFTALNIGSTSGMFKVGYGDQNGQNAGSMLTNSVNRPYYRADRVPTQIKLRGLYLG